MQVRLLKWVSHILNSEAKRFFLSNLFCILFILFVYQLISIKFDVSVFFATHLFLSQFFYGFIKKIKQFSDIHISSNEVN